ncbi:hypothetical protein D3C72_1892180 [compost metagenome]
MRAHGGDGGFGFARQPGAVGVHHDGHARPRAAAHGGQRIGGALVQLDLGIALIQGARCHRVQALGVAVVLKQRRIDAHALAALAAQ